MKLIMIQNLFFKYISLDSLKYANETLMNIYSRISELKTTPYIGRFVPEISDKDYRELIYKNYRIVYKVSEETNIVYICFVLHTKRNFISFFNSYIKSQ